jgi:hypothetical protein
MAQEYQLPNIVWRGPRGSGKHSALQEFLQSIAENLKVPYVIQMKRWSLANGTIATGAAGTEGAAEDDDDDPEDASKGIPYEATLIHRAFDVARMSLQDKNYVAGILGDYEGTSSVLLGCTGASQQKHIVIFYHAHLLSDESLLLIQEALEKYPMTLSIMLTSEYPLPARIADIFFEIPVGGGDSARERLREKWPRIPEVDSWTTFFDEAWTAWKESEPSMQSVIMLRRWIYECHLRNLRWCDFIQLMFECVLRHRNELTVEQYRAILKQLASAEGGGGWSLLPSYRMPIAWEGVLLDIYDILWSKK